VFAGLQHLGGDAAQQARADWEAATQPLRRRYNVGHHPSVLVGVPASRAPEARLHLVDNQ
jgi:hypothetical protein